MAIDGSYNVVVKSPMGDLDGTLTLRAEGGSLSGSVAGQMGAADFASGTVKGDEASWSMEVPGPLGKMKATCRVTVNGDSLNGEVKAGFFGSFPLHGKRA